MRIAALMLILFLLPTQIGSAKEGDFVCVRSFCGCWTDVLITYEATIFNTNHIPQTDIQVFCLNQLNTFLGTTDSSGKIKMNIATSVSPGCGLGCGVLKLVKETSTTFNAWSSDIDYSKLKNIFNDKKVEIADGIIILNRPYQKGKRRNGVYEGVWQEWCASRQGGFSGNLRVSGTYKNGLKDGEWYEWYCEGEKKSVVRYKGGKKEGTSIEWYQNGQTHQEIEYRDDKMNGRWISWYPNGQIEGEIEMRDGKRFGISTYYSKDGKKSFADSKGHFIQDPDDINLK